MVPSGSVDPAELNVTASGALPDVGLAPATATGAWLGALVVTVTVAVSDAPLSSVTVRVAVWLPAVV